MTGLSLEGNSLVRPGREHENVMQVGVRENWGKSQGKSFDLVFQLFATYAYSLRLHLGHARQISRKWGQRDPCNGHARPTSIAQLMCWTVQSWSTNRLMNSNLVT